jgi:hypothetical protein
MNLSAPTGTVAARTEGRGRTSAAPSLTLWRGAGASLPSVSSRGEPHLERHDPAFATSASSPG